MLIGSGRFRSSRPRNRSITAQPIFRKSGIRPTSSAARKWAVANEWTLYTASSESVAWAEYCRNHAADVDSSDVTGGVGLREPFLSSLAGLGVDAVLAQRALYRLTFGFTRLARPHEPMGWTGTARLGLSPESHAGTSITGTGIAPPSLLSRRTLSGRRSGCRLPHGEARMGGVCRGFRPPGRAPFAQSRGDRSRCESNGRDGTRRR